MSDLVSPPNPLAKLVVNLNSNGFEVTEDEVITALQTVSAHRSLQAISLAVHNIFESIDHHQDEDVFPVAFDRRSLEVLRAISRLKNDQEGWFWMPRTSIHNKQPLYGHTGDSPVCDCFLVQPRDLTLKFRYEDLICWLLFLVLRLPQNSTELLESNRQEIYRRYLNEETSERLIDTDDWFPHAVRAGEFVRSLIVSEVKEGDAVTSQEKLENIGKFLGRPNERNGRRFARALFAIKFFRKHKFSPEDEEKYWNDLRSDDDLTYDEFKNCYEAIPSAFGILFRDCWPSEENITASLQTESEGERKSEGGKKAGERKPRKQAKKLETDEGAELRTIVPQVVIDHQVGGDKTVSGVSTPPEKIESTGSSEKPLFAGEDHEEELPFQALIKVGKGKDLVSNVSHSKGMYFELSRQNAALPFGKNHLSTTAIQYLLEQMVPVSDSDSLNMVRAKLAIGLSLLTGRKVDQFLGIRAVECFEPDENHDETIVFCRSARTFWLRMGSPPLKRKEEAASDFQQILHSHIEWLQLSPPSLLELHTHKLWSGSNSVEQPNERLVRKTLKNLVKGAPNHLAISKKKIPFVFVRVLAKLCDENVGLIQTITDSRYGGNNSVLHYASFQSYKLSVQWNKAIATVLDQSIEFGNTYVTSSCVDSWVGSYHPIDADKLTVEIKAIHTELVRMTPTNWGPSVDKNELIRFYNLYTVYTLLWCHLACVSRGGKTVAPIAIYKNCALISDKHHDSGLMERVLPLTEAFSLQLRRYYAFVEYLGSMNTNFKRSKPHWRDGVVVFDFLDSRGNQIINRPSFLKQFPVLSGLPGNWARKFVTSHSKEISGRYLSVAMGHWSMGRHCWGPESSFQPDDFFAQFLKQQNVFEEQLGLSPLDVPGLEAVKAFPAHSFEFAEPPDKRPTLSDAEKERLDTDLQSFVEHFKNIETPDKFYVRDRICECLKAFSDDKHLLCEFGERACLEARKRWSSPITWHTVSTVYHQRNELSHIDFCNLCLFEQNVAPLLDKELKELPAFPDQSKRRKWSGKEREKACELEVGRLLLILATQQRLVSWKLIRPFLSAVAKNIVAFSSLRVVKFEVMMDGANQALGRTVLLEPFTSAYLINLMSHFPEAIKALTEDNRSYGYAMSSLQTYLDEMCGKDKFPAKQIFKAIKQKHVLAAGPLLGAYAAVEVETHDMSISTFAKTLGFAFSTDMEPEDTFQANSESFERQLPEVGDEGMVSNFLSLDASEPAELENWRGILKPQSIVEKIMASFMRWTWRYGIKDGSRRLTNKAKLCLIQAYVELINLCLVRSKLEEASVFDDEWLEAMKTDFHTIHPEINSDQAFNYLRNFFASKNPLKEYPELNLNLVFYGKPGSKTRDKILLKQQELRIIKSIDRKIPAADALTKAFLKVVFCFAAGSGARRNELAYLRGLDFQVDSLLIQGFKNHTVKTVNAIRSIVVEFLEGTLASFLKEKDRQSFQHALAKDPDWVMSSSDKWFDELNKIIQEVTCDTDISLHVLRHTLATSGFLSLARPSLNVDQLIQDIPWLSDFWIKSSKQNSLIYGDHDKGEGLQALSTLLGHGHPLTTVKHYVHAAFIAHYGYLLTREPIDLSKTFTYRHKSKTTMYEYRKDWLKIEDIQMRNKLITAELEKKYSGLVVLKYIGEEETQKFLDENERFNFIEMIQEVDKKMRAPDAFNLEGFTKKSITSRFREVECIQSAKKGLKQTKHQLEPVRHGRVPIPFEPKLGQAEARMVLTWLEHLRHADPEGLNWFLNLWLKRVKPGCGSVRTTSDEERDKLESIEVENMVRFKVIDQKPKQAKTSRYVKLEIADDNEKSPHLVAGSRWAILWFYSLLPDLNRCRPIAKIKNQLDMRFR